MGYVFRAFHALPHLTNARGLPTQATLGFLNMVRKLMKQAHPAHLAVVMDAPGPTFREKTYEAYKAHRPSMPEELAVQLPYIRRVTQALRLPVLEYPGFEADDLIGALARQAAEQKLSVVIVSSDKDMLQLVNDRVCVLNPTRGDWLCDPAEVERVLGVRPDQVVDLLALRGDAVDNIPGAPGIGEKGARDLIARFGALDTLLARAAEVERKSYRESLLRNREQILLSRELATIHTAAPVPLELEALRAVEPDLEACRALYTELEFYNLLKELPPAAAAPALPAESPAWIRREWKSPDELSAWLRAAGNRPLALLTGQPAAAAELALSGAAGLALATENEAGLAGPELFPVLAEALRRSERVWCVHECRRLRRRLRDEGLPLPPHLPDRLLDTQLLAYLLDPARGRYELEALVRARLGAGWYAGAGEADPAAAACALARLAPGLRAEVEALQLWPLYRDLDLPLAPVLEAMEAAGVGIDLAALRALSADLQSQCQALETEIFSLAGGSFNLNSPRQVGEVLFAKLGLPAPPRRGKTKSLSTAVDVLEDLAGDYPIAARMLAYRQLAKLKSTYVDALPPLVAGTGRLHTSFSQVGAVTGRLSSSNPNLQNIPIRSRLGRQIRSAFCAAPGMALVVADYSQIELRLLAHFSQDPLLLAAYQSGGDIHRLTASEVFGVKPEAIDDEQRRRAKAVNFGIVYGLSAFGLARQLGIPQSEAAEFIRRYFERYAGVRRYIDERLAAARQEGGVRTLWGRLRPIPDLASRNPAQRGFAERTAINSPLQGTAADLMRLAMLRVHARFADGPTRLLLQVHDELVLEAPAAQARAVADAVRSEMEAVAALRVPLVAETGFGPNWRDLNESGSC